MGTEDLILDLEIMSNIYQCQIINLQLARHRALKLKVGDTQPSLKPTYQFKLNTLVQKPNENVRMYIIKYANLHQTVTSKRPE